MFGTLPKSRFFAPILAGLGLLLLAAWIGIRVWFYQPFNMPSAAMEPTLLIGDNFLVSKGAYRTASPTRGEVVVFIGQDGHTSFVKRIVGLPGDRVQMRQGRLFLNGAALPLRRLDDYLEDCDGKTCHVARYAETFPGGATDQILDRVPNGVLDDTGEFVVPKDSYFVLGDNRDNSDDSRANLGFIPRDRITGRVSYRYITGGQAVWQPVN